MISLTMLSLGLRTKGENMVIAMAATALVAADLYFTMIIASKFKIEHMRTTNQF